MLRIGLAQINSTVGDIKGNTRKILRWIERARKQRADIVAFPELAVSGYPAEDLLLRKRFLADCLAGCKRIAQDCGPVIAVVGFPYRAEATYNSAAVMTRGRIAAICNKVHLPNYGVFDEERYFTPADRATVLAIGSVKVGVSICEDIWVEDVTSAQVVAGGAQVILNISSSPYYAGKGSEREEMLRARATGNGAYVAYVNLVGGQDELVFDGHSVVIDPAGTTVARGKQFAEDMVVVDIDAGSVPTRPGRRRSGLRRIPVEISAIAAKPRRRAAPIVPVVRPVKTRLDEILSAIVMGTRDYVKKNGFKKVVVGLSGGIDSSLVATLAMDALGRDGVVGVSMPSRYSSASSVADAAALAGDLGIRLLTINIDSIFQRYLETLRSVFRRTKAGVAEENIQARIRGNILMALSNKFGWLVLTTGNKSELAVGYCTLYGDLAGGFAILKDVPKTLVYDLARHRNSLGRPVIPEAVFTKPPSAELRPDQKDEDSLPPYETLDSVLDMYVVEDMAIGDIVGHGYPRRLVREIAGMVDGNEYKRRQGPPGIKITPRAFGKDRRMPITNRYL